MAGRAAYAHVNGIAGGLRKRGFEVCMAAREVAPDAPRRWARRSATMASLLVKAMIRLPGSDIVYIRSHPAALPLSLTAVMLGVPVIHEINGRMEDLGLTYKLSSLFLRSLIAMQSWQYRFTDGFAAVTPGFGHWVIGKSARNRRKPALAIIPNAADTTLFRPDAQAGPRFARPYVLFFGSLTAWHGADIMRAALAAPDWPDGVDLVLAGDGPQTARLRDAALYESRLKLLGDQSPQAIAGIAARAVATLVPITWHGGCGEAGVAPIKLDEGMAAGRPVIVSDQPFQRDVVEASNCGIVFKADEPAALARAVARLQGDAALADAMGARARAAAEANGDWKHRAAATAELINQVMASRRQ